MTRFTMDLPKESQRCIDAHLDAIDDTLRRSGMARGERQSILDDVQTQIREMLAGRVEGVPGGQDVQAVIAELDSPESYAAEATSTSLEELPIVPPRLSKAAMAGIAWAGLFFVVFLPLMLLRVSVPAGSPPPSYPVWLKGLLLFFVMPVSAAAPFGTTILGLIAIYQIRISSGRLYGLVFAVADTLLFPLLAVTFATAVIAATPRILAMSLAIWFVLAVFIVRWTWRAASKPYNASRRSNPT